ncbi:Protein of unknown function [Raineyella antarctica]|uniref:DUF1653 domain-containing protein n=1 Tax=Raineyella antarctica TaxID=1577474 RepID=A0A1G6HGW9_9ACTN|nr:DUF1653 domain-containing protein [Raineyella antarctica]SDB93175.1 Protein of unknown function [Raineyella antarctica]
MRIRYRDKDGQVGWHRLRVTGARDDAGTWLIVAEEPGTRGPLELALADVLGWQSALEVAAAADRLSSDRSSADAPVPGVYRHYKGSFYWLLEVATHSETRELMAVYRCLYGDFSTWVRPWAMFNETVLVDGIEVPRFAYVAPLS